MYAIMNVKTHDLMIVSGSLQFSKWGDEKSSSLFETRGAAQIIANDIQNDFRASNKAAGERLEVVFSKDWA